MYGPETGVGGEKERHVQGTTRSSSPGGEGRVGEMKLNREAGSQSTGASG